VGRGSLVGRREVEVKGHGAAYGYKLGVHKAGSGLRVCGGLRHLPKERCQQDQGQDYSRHYRLIRSQAIHLGSG